MRLDTSAKVQIHVGGAYGDRDDSKKKFVSNYKNLLSEKVKKRLVIENDDHIYNLNDCIEIHLNTDIPILFDIFHHQCFGDNLPLIHAVQTASDTWYKNRDGIIMIDYSNQEPNERKGKHSNTLDMKQFKEFILSIASLDLDIMLEVKDKENSAKNAIRIINQL